MVRPPQPDGCWSEGQIALEEARFCVACELMVADTFHCRRCESEIVWPLARWVSCPAVAESVAADMRRNAIATNWTEMLTALLVQGSIALLLLLAG